MQLNNEYFSILDNEFPQYKHIDYTNLKLYPKLGELEREISLIKEIANIYQKVEFINIGLSHGGYLPIKLIPIFDQIYIVDNNDKQLENLNKNRELYDLDKKIIVYSKFSEIKHIDNIKLVRIETNDNIIQYLSNFIILSYQSIQIPNSKMYKLTNSNLHLFVSLDLIDKFDDGFRYYLENNELKYDNLLQLCMIVKNAGDGFREILEKNLEYIDQWTILDTGSTDNTIETIKDVMKNKKGNLYQEPFINFRDSRNRCLDLAGISCKFTVMLDDTCIMKGNVRNFLNLIRSDQFADSYNTYYNISNNIFGSNRIIKSEKKLRYVYRIHEIIQSDNNVIVQIPLDQILIEDVESDYMKIRTNNRIESDLALLYETLEEYPDIPRTLFYIAQTYIRLKMWDKAWEYCEKRIEFPIIGYSEEITECYLLMGEIAQYIFKWSWDKCEKLYLKCYDYDKTRADSLFFIAKYYLDNNDSIKAYKYLKDGFELDISTTATSNLKYNIYQKLIPYHLSIACYTNMDYVLGELATEKYLKYNEPDDTIVSLNKIYKLFNKKNKIKNQYKKILCIISDKQDNLIIKIVNNLINLSNFDVYYFYCTTKKEIINNIKYCNIENYMEFSIKHSIHTCIISELLEYIPLTIENNIENIYLILSNTTINGNIIPINDKLKNIICTSEDIYKYFLTIFPIMESKTICQFV